MPDRPEPAVDLLYLLLPLAFFVLMVLLARGLERL